MNTMNRPDELEFIAFAEGRIDPESARGREIAAMLRNDPEAEAMVQNYQAQDKAIRRHYAPIMAAPIPAQLRISNIQSARRRRSRGWLNWAGAAVLVLAMGLLLSRGPATQAPADSSDLDVFAARVAGHLMQPELASPAPISDLSGIASQVLAGFEPTTARQALVEGEHLSEVIYQDAQGQNLRLFISEPSASAAQALHSVQAGDHELVYWQHEGRHYALVGNVSQERLDDIASRAMIETSSDAMQSVAEVSTPGENTISEVLEENPSLLPAVNDATSHAEAMPTTVSEDVPVEIPL